MIRPNDGLWMEGFESLSTSELLALLIRGRTPHWTAELIGAQILASVGHNLCALERFTIGDLTKFRGIGRSKAMIILAAFELGRRRAQSKQPLAHKLESSKAVYEFMKPALCHLSHEEFWVLFLNAAQGLSGISQISKGGVTATIVDVRLLLKKALDYRAVSLILVHNHPSGNVVPSGSDRALTERVATAAGNLDIKVLDHLIVSEKAYFSFADQQLL